MENFNNSNKNGDKCPGPIPDRWLNCPRVSSTVIAGKFLAFKVPLNIRFTPKLEAKDYFQPSAVFDYMKLEKVS